jgi:hypothetical protein
MRSVPESELAHTTAAPYFELRTAVEAVWLEAWKVFSGSWPKNSAGSELNAHYSVSELREASEAKVSSAVAA